MPDSLKHEDTRTLLQTIQQTRTHWGSVITTHLSVAISANIAVWSFFLKSYVDSFDQLSSSGPSYIAVASAISSILIGLWRLYTRYIDNNIARLYPEFILYEGTLGSPVDSGTSGYLIKNVPNLSPILTGNFTLQQRVEAIAKVIESKRIGTRGHFAIDVFAASIIILTSCISFSQRSQLVPEIALPCFIAMTLGFLFLLIGFLRYQKKPSKSFISKIIQSYLPVKQTKT